MKTSHLFALAALLIPSFSFVAAQNVTDEILTSAAADDINLDALDDVVLAAAMAEIEETYASAPERRRRSLDHGLGGLIGRLMGRQSPFTNIVDSHAHVAPAWYKALYPEIGGNPVPDWTMTDQLNFMEGQSIQHAIFAFSTPGPNVYRGNKVLTVALARLMNEVAAAYCRAHPGRFSFYAQVPLPYTQEAIREAQYALNTLGAVGIWLQSNVEGKYLGNTEFKSFFQTVNSWPGRQILYIHPTIPLMKVGNQLIEANPTPYITGKIEFYFETARTLMDLTLTQTIHNFTNIDYVIPHVGGGFPATIDRILKSYPTLYDPSFNIFKTRFWWDSAGPTFFHQVSGLLGYGIPASQLLYGTDFPYAPIAPQAGSLAAVKNSGLFTAVDKHGIFRDNARRLFGNKINWVT